MKLIKLRSQYHSNKQFLKGIDFSRLAKALRELEVAKDGYGPCICTDADYMHLMTVSRSEGIKILVRCLDVTNKKVWRTE